MTMKKTLARRIAGIVTGAAMLMAMLPLTRAQGASGYSGALDTGNLTIAKEVAHDFGTDYQIPADKSFTVDVTLTGPGTALATFEAAHTNGGITQITTDEGGRFTVQLHHDEQVTLFGLPAGTQAAVVERVPGSGFTPVYWDDGVPGDGIVTVAGNFTASVMVVNDYVAGPVEPVNIALGGEVVVTDLQGQRLTQWPDDYRFTVVMERHDADGWHRIDSRVLDQAQQSYTFDLSGEVYDVPGVYSYQIYELEPAIGEADRVPGIIYEMVWHTFSVYVEDPDMDGKLDIVRVYSEHAEKDFEMVDGVYQVNLNFENIQADLVPALATVDYQLRLSNPSGSPLVSLAGYHFGLYTDVACTIPATLGSGVSAISLNPTDAVGEGWIDIRLDSPGSYTFYIRQINDGFPGMAYSAEVIRMVVEVKPHPLDSQALTAQISYFTADGSAYDVGEDGEVEFYNVYTAAEAELVVDFVYKELVGAELVGGAFTFEIRSQDGRFVLKGTNDDQGRVLFADSLTFDKVGTYLYSVAETDTRMDGIALDKTIYRLGIAVTDLGGQLQAACSVISVVGDVITFCNAYSPASVDHVIGGTVSFNGMEPELVECIFRMTALAVDGQPLQEQQSWLAMNFSDGSFHFPAITYDRPGSYTYRVESQAAENGILCDSTVYLVTVVVEDSGTGRLRVTAESLTLEDGTAVEGLTFQHRYHIEANPVTGDFDALLWLGLMTVGTVAMAALGLAAKKKRK